MAFFLRYKSAPQLQSLNDRTSIAFTEAITLADGGIIEDEISKANLDKNMNVSDLRCVPEDLGFNLVSATGMPHRSKSDGSPEVYLRNRHHVSQVPGAVRHSYGCDLDTFTIASSSGEIEPAASESKLFYQTSTDSESNFLECTSNSNLPEGIVGTENNHKQTTLNDSTLTQSPRSRSRLNRLREAFRSPQIGRRRTPKDKGEDEKSPRVRRAVLETNAFVKLKKPKSEDGSKSPKARKNGSTDSAIEMSSWVIALGYADLEVDQEFEVKRVPEYDIYLGELLEETDPAHPDYVELSQALSRVHSMIKKREDELGEDEQQSTMDIAADKSPVDDISPHLSNDSSCSSSNISTPEVTTSVIISSNVTDDKYSVKPKGLSLRRRSAPSALLFKSLSGSKSKSATSLWSNGSIGKKEHDVFSHFKIANGESNRSFVAEGSVQFFTGMQIQERYLFLFSDLLLVTKQKSSTAFKLKHRVHLRDMWIASCIEEVTETTRPADRSFVFGWPTTNVVATFPTEDTRNEWLSKLDKLVSEDRLKDTDKEIHLKVTPRDIESAARKSCLVYINNVTQAKDVLLECLKQLNLSENDAKEYQLWVASGKEGTPYPLIGHETPFSIKLNQIRDLVGDEIGNMTAADLDAVVNNGSSPAQKCEFYLKQKKTPRKNHFEDSALPKSMKKTKKSPNIFNTLFRKKRQPAQHLVFGLPLSEVCDENLDPPEAIIKLMVLVYQQGPRTPGIMRRGNKATLGKEIREKIDSGDKYTLESHVAPTAASVFKEFLRCIPEGLLINDMHAEWAAIKKSDPHIEKIQKIKKILAKLPPAHYRMLKLTVCLLQHLAKHSSQNQMGPSNLATCIAPSFYTHSANNTSNRKLKGDAVKQLEMQNSVFEIQNFIVPLISFMIINHVELFGEDILNLFTKYGCEASPKLDLHEDKPESPMHASVEEDEEEDLIGDEEDDDEMGFSDQHLKRQHRRQQQQQRVPRDSNSGTDSDSMHSVLSIQETGMGLGQNNSSVDSLVDREFYAQEAESSPKTTNSHLSPNLSRDSGLTLSDTQLYDEEACHADTAVNMPTKVYQRSASHVIESQSKDTYERNIYYPGMDGQFDNAINPIAPPRKRSVRKGKDSSEGSDSEQNGFNQYLPRRAPFKYTVSNTQPEKSSRTARPGELRPMLTHPPLGKRISSDSIGEEEDELTNDQIHEMEFQRMRSTSDSCTIMKSESGSHLYLNEEALPVKYSLVTPTSKTQRRFVRQSSVTEITPPVSPQSRYSQSSHDSVMSESTYSVSRDDSVHSTPHTPEEPHDKPVDWDLGISLPGKPWDRRLFINNLSNQISLSYSKSASDLSASMMDTLHSPEYITKFKPSSPKLRPGKFHEAEEIEMNGSSPHFQFLVKSGDYYTDKSFHTLLGSPQNSNYQHRKSWMSTHIDKGSPPPKIILQALHSSRKEDSISFKVDNDSKAKVSSVDSLGLSIGGVRHEDYLNVKSKPIIISPPAERLLNALSSSSSSRAKLSKYMSSSMDLPSKSSETILTEYKRPEKPPAYQEALERNYLLKQQSVDSAYTKAVNDSSHVYKEQRNVKSIETRVTKAELDPDVLSEVSQAVSVKGRPESSFLCYEAQDNVQLPTTSRNLENRFSFTDTGTIPPGLLKDTNFRYDDPTNAYTGSPKKIVSLVSSGQLSRNDSKLSDSSSTSNSSVTVSVLSTRSSSFGHPSDFSDSSSIIVSSPTSSDTTSETSSILSRNRSSTEYDLQGTGYNQYFLPVKHESLNKDERDMTGNRINTNVNGRLRKDPRHLYMQSLHIYEQNKSTGIDKAVTASPSSSSLQQQPSRIISKFPSQIDFLTLKEATPSRPVTVLRQSTAEAISSTQNITNISHSKNRSMSVEHLPQLGTYTLTSHKHVNVQPYFKSKEFKPDTLPQDIRSEHRQNFLKAKSYFNNSAGDHTSSASSHFPVKSLSSEETTSKKWHAHMASSSSVPEDMTVESALQPNSKSKVTSKTIKHSTDGSGNEHRQEFHWSVKSLKSIYDKDFFNNDTGSDANVSMSKYSKESTSQLTSQGRPRSPPRYKNPPPFKSAQDASHNAPITGSTSTETSSLVNKSDFCRDNEALSDHTKITYV